MATAKKKAASTGSAAAAAPAYKVGDRVRVLAGDFGAGQVSGNAENGVYLVDLDKYKGTDFGPVKFRGALLAAA